MTEGVEENASARYPNLTVALFDLQPFARATFPLLTVCFYLLDSRGSRMIGVATKSPKTLKICFRVGRIPACDRWTERHLFIA